MSLPPEERERLRRKFVEYKATRDRKLRNELMHWKPEIHWGDEERDLEKLLKPRIGVNRLFRVGSPWFPHHVLCASCADWAVRRSVEFVDIGRYRMGVHDYHTPVMASWPNP